MKRLLLAISLATTALSTQAGSNDQWFYDGLPWYRHPCGMQAFARYGHSRSPVVRHAYQVTRRDPSQCSVLFP